MTVVAACKGSLARQQARQHRHKKCAVEPSSLRARPFSEPGRVQAQKRGHARGLQHWHDGHSGCSAALPASAANISHAGQSCTQQSWPSLQKREMPPQASAGPEAEVVTACVKTGSNSNHTQAVPVQTTSKHLHRPLLLSLVGGVEKHRLVVAHRLAVLSPGRAHPPKPYRVRPWRLRA